MECEYEGVRTAEILTKINDYKRKLQCHQFFNDIIATIQAGLEQHPVTILCYGVGRLGSSRTAQTQYAMMLLIKEHFQVTEGLLYDPILHKEEKSAVELSSISLIPYNEVIFINIYSCQLCEGISCMTHSMCIVLYKNKCLKKC